MSLKSRITEYSRKHGEWINGGHYEKLAMSVGYKASNCSRRLRELADEGVLDRRENSRGCVEYRHVSFREAPKVVIQGNLDWLDSVKGTVRVDRGT